jgi:hypothetical protein
MMKSIARQSIPFGRVLTLVFLLASARFTSILHICMKKPDKALPVAGMSIYKGDACHSTIVFSGLRVVMAFVEKDSKVQNVEVLPLLTSPFVSPAPGNTSTWFSYFFFESVSPPSVDKYVLNATFLI